MEYGDESHYVCDGMHSPGRFNAEDTGVSDLDSIADGICKDRPREFMMGCIADDPQCDDEEKPGHVVIPMQLNKTRHSTRSALPRKLLLRIIPRLQLKCVGR